MPRERGLSGYLYASHALMILVLGIHLECEGMGVCIRSSSREVMLHMIIIASITIILNSVSMAIGTGIKLRWRLLMTGFQRLSDVCCLVNSLAWDV